MSKQRKVMAIREIVLYPNDVLITPTQRVEKITDEIRDLVQDLIDTMYDAPGIGLAAPQIGVLKRVAVVDTSRKEEDPPELVVMINPDIIEAEGEITWEEGCLSFPKVYEKINRPGKVKMRAMNLDGEFFEIVAEDLLGVALQHEIDHLDGIMFLERMSKLKRKRALKRYKKVLDDIAAGIDSDEEIDD